MSFLWKKNSRPTVNKMKKAQLVTAVNKAVAEVEASSDDDG